MKKIAALLMTLILALSLAACAAKTEVPAETEAATETAAEPVETVAETESASPQINGDEPIIGAWLVQIEKKNYVSVFMEDGAGYGIELANEKEIRLMDYVTLTWSNNSDGTFACDLGGESDVILTYDEQADTMSAGDIIYTRLDAITGIWTAETEDGEGKPIIATHTFKIDGTEQLMRLYEDGTVAVTDYCWSRNADGTFTISTFDSDASYVWTVSDDGKTVTSSTGRTFTRRYDDTYYYLSILGPWYNEETEAVCNFSGDGTGKRYSEDGVIDFDWEIPEFGQFKLTYHGDDYEGKESIWTYDRENNVLITGGMTGEIYTLIRPNKKIEGLSHTVLDRDAYIGQWGNVFEREDGTSEEVVYTVNADGTAYLMTLGDDIGIQLTHIYSDVWEKTGDNKYKVTVENEAVHEHTYDAASDTITSESGMVLKRLDPIVGIWSTVSPYNAHGTNYCSTTTIVKSDGTGLYSRDMKDGTVECDALTWNKNADGTYKLKFGNGSESEWELDYTGYTARPSSGGTKKKEFLDRCFLMSITGAWYNEERDISIIVNADGTGILNTTDYLADFNWELGEIGKFNISYTSGNWGDGSDATGKETVWIYDRDRNVLITSKGTEYTRVMKSVEGKITIVNE